MNIKDYGWNSFFNEQFKEMTDENNIAGRIVADYGQKLRVVSNLGELLLDRPVNKPQLQLAVGDWVVFESVECTELGSSTYCITRVLRRRTKFSRAAAGPELKEQIVAANVDTVFLVQSLNKDFNMRRLERYLISAWESGAIPVVVLTKADICENTAERMAEVYKTAPGVEVYTVSSVTGEGISEIKRYLGYGKTVALLGSSGVGKSTLVNTLAGTELLKTQEIREDDSKGRHTTTHRELVLLPDGGLILDTPGMRMLSLWEADTGVDIMFGDIEELIEKCRFHDCTHGNEPGCAVREAIESESLDAKRWESFQKLQKELRHIEAKKAGKERQAEKLWGKQISKFQKEFYKVNR